MNATVDKNMVGARSGRNLTVCQNTRLNVKQSALLWGGKQKLTLMKSPINL